MSMHYYIFDYDGVLADTWALRNEYMSKRRGISYAEAERQGIEFFSTVHKSTKHMTDEDYAKAINFNQTYGRHFSELGYKLFEKFFEELANLKNTKFAIVTNASTTLVGARIKEISTTFDPILTFEDHYSKVKKVQMVCRTWRIDIKQAYYFTDTKSDVFELSPHFSKEKIIGCCWGYHGYDTLREILPDKQLLRTFSDIR